MESVFKCVEHTTSCQHLRHSSHSTAASQQEVLHLAVKQYRPTGYVVHDGDATIIASHSSGAPKELYEPVWEELFRRAAGRSPGRRIRSILIADVVNQGQSGLLNEGRLGNDVSWFDHARDLLALVNELRPHIVRPVLGFGHSMGANIIINLALLHPRLFAGVGAVEATINRDAAEMEKTFLGVPSLALKRDTWPSRDAAITFLSKGPLYSGWDRRVLDLFRQYGLRNHGGASASSDAPVTLTTTRHQEVFTFARTVYPPKGTDSFAGFVPDRWAHPEMEPLTHDLPHPFYRPEAIMTYHQLPLLRPSCLFVYGSKSHMAGAKPGPRADKLMKTGTATGGSGGVAAGRVHEAIAPGSHWVPFEAPQLIAALADDWFEKELEQWAAREAADVQAWQQVPLEQRGQIDSELLLWAKKMQPVRKSKDKTQAKL